MNAKILLLLSPERRSKLMTLLEGKDMQIFLASDFRDAQQKLSGRISYDLLVADVELPDGTWQDLLQLLLESKRPCEMILCSRSGDDRLWAEALQCGAYDLLVEPYEQQEVHRIIESALASHYMQRFTQMVNTAVTS